MVWQQGKKKHAAAAPSRWRRFADFVLARASGASAEFPPHMQLEFSLLQEKSEFLISSAHGVMLLAIVALICLSGTGLSSGHGLAGLLCLVAAMGVLTAARLYLSFKHLTPDWFLRLSIVLEMALMTGLLWLYHARTAFSAGGVDIEMRNIYFVYVFILMALRTLRFDAPGVLISGATAACCWWMIALAEGEAGSGPILPAAAMDKIISILVVSVILALVLVRTRNTLLESVQHSQAAKNLSLFFDKAVAERISRHDMNITPGHGELRPAAILFTDLRGFTHASSALAPDQLIALLMEYQQLVVPIIQAHGGNIDKFMGDGILASFGAVKASTSYAADALRTVDDITMALKLWQLDRSSSGLVTVDIGMGVGVGDVVFAVMGDETRLEFTVIGGTVNLAAKLEKHNKITATRALTTRLGYDVAVSQGYNGPEKQLLEHCEVGGVDHPIDLMKLA